MNSLRAAVLGANDGIVSVAGIVVGVAGATTSRSAIITAGLAGLAAGALSMAAGEYVSVSSQKDTQKALLKQEARELQENPDGELQELAEMYQAKGLTHKTALKVAQELTEHDALAAHADIELHVNPDELSNPWQAGLASASSFIVGAAIPMLAVSLGTQSNRILITFASVIAALLLTGYVSATASGSHRGRAMVRVVAGGIIAMLATYFIGKLVGVHGGL